MRADVRSLQRSPPRGLALARQALAELLRSPSPAYARGGEPRPAMPLPARLDLDAIVASLRGEALEIDVRTRALHGPWTWFVRAPRSSAPLELGAPRPIDGGARLVLDASGTTADHVGLSWPLAPGERIVGLGERTVGVDLHGWRLECWAEEGAIGLGETMSPMLTALGAPWNPFPKGPAVTYKPVPWLISSRGYAIFLDTTAPAFFDVGASDPGELRVEVMATRIEIVVLVAPTPAALLQRLIELTDGKPRGLPDWALAPWLDALGGQPRVEEVARVARAARIPCGAIWSEDWQGLERKPFGDSTWSYDAIFPVKRRPDRALYPALETMIGDLHDRGFAWMTYYYPYVPLGDEDHAEASAAGHFLRDRAGVQCVIPLFMDEASQVDLTNPAARAWYKGELRRGLALGVDGWMADFGEYTPIAAVAHDGEPGHLHHNRYPRLWAGLHRELLDEARPDGEAMFFSRSGAPGQQRDTPLFWNGDSNTDFERWDGLPGNVRALLSAGLSGFSVWTVDIGGYTCLITRGRDAETLARWTELGAFLIVMRTHHGTHVRRCVQFDHDAATLAHFATYARFHAALFPLRRQLLAEAIATGLPIARPLLLEYPDDPVAWAIEDQFLLGELLVAPVLARGARGREVYHPAGRDWIDAWSGARTAGGTRVDRDAPVGRIPLAIAADGLVPTFDAHVDTFARRPRVRDPGLATLDDAERCLALLVGPDFRGARRLYDGTVVTFVSGALAEPGPRAAREAPHPLLPPELLDAWRCVGAGVGATVAVPWPGGALQIVSPHDRAVRVFAPVG
ncbi:MAG: hypothetical protein K8W52_47070 [Deltaproteobacteria bacterium]|nr:hypothetical protein [Deltaproteobacteria bacterium]